MRSAVVVGAGVGGLAVAGGLARTGWRVTLLERGDRLRAGGSALLLRPDAIRALHALGLSGGLDAIATAVPSTGVRRPDGRWLLSPNTATGRIGPVAVHEADLHDTLIAGLSEHVWIRTGVNAHVAASRNRPAVASAEQTWEADLIVAADGAYSALRARIAPESRAISTGCAAWRAVIPWYRVPRLHPDVALAGETLGAGHRFRYASLGADGGGSTGSSRGGVYWVATVPGAPRPEPPAQQLALLRRWFAGWHSPVPELLEATAPEDLVTGPVAALRPMPRRFAAPVGTGGLVLLGDAAHAMPHHLGVGAGLAIEDAATLVELVRQAAPGRSLASALSGYNRARRPRALQAARQSHRVGVVVQARGRITVRARDAALGISPRLARRASRANSADAWQPPGPAAAG